MRTKTVLVLIIACFLTSCGLIKITGGNPIEGLYSSYNATQEQYPGLLVKADSTSFCELEYPQSPKVYLINGQQMKQCLADFDDAIVYLWAPYCPAEQCFSPSLMQKYCDEKNVELFVVTEYFAAEELIQFYDIKRPLFGIDTQYYKTNFIDKYVDRFETDLAVDDTRMGRMLYFKKGKYVGVATIEFEK